MAFLTIRQLFSVFLKKTVPEEINPRDTNNDEGEIPALVSKSNQWTGTNGAIIMSSSHTDTGM